MAKIFERLGMRKPRYSGFDLSHERKLSCDMGQLIPILCKEVVPGDSFRCNSEIMMRLAPMVAPVMHRVKVYTHYFFVPNRLLWQQWENFITGGQDGESAPTMPTVAMSNALTTKGSLGDYLGLPLVGEGDAYFAEVSQLPFRAYRSIWNEYYRDPNLDAEVDILTPDSAIYDIAQRCWEKDYFTSALPWTQRGPEVDLPVSFEYMAQSNVVAADDSISSGLQVDGANYLEPASVHNPAIGQRIENLEENAVSVSINELRRASALQRFLEKNARGGYRYIEQILTHFGVKSSDARLQRPEYLGGGQQPIVISEVLNTTGTTSAPQGEMAGHGISVGTMNKFSRRFEEHGYIMGIMSVLPRTNYQQGIHKHWLRADKLDYYFPEFANLGEQEIKQMELYYDSAENEATNNAAFGYQQRFAEYKYGISTVHGDFKDNLDFWHMGRIFENPPALNSNFVTSDPTNRIYAVPGEAPGDVQHLYVHVYNDVRARRPMPYFSDPRLS
jgi:hypothetical protein